MAVAPNLWVTLLPVEVKFLPVITWNKKHSPKQVLSIKYTIVNKFFAAATFKGL